MSDERKLIHTQVEDDVDTSEKSKVTTNNGDNVGTDDNSQVTTTDEPKDITSILQSVTKKAQTKNEKIQVSIYLDEDVHKKYQKFGRKFSKGARSELVNELLRKALEEY